MTRPIHPELREEASDISPIPLDPGADQAPHEPAADPGADAGAIVTAPLGAAVPGHGLNPYSPGEEENLAAGLAFSTVAHVAIVAVVAVYGLTLLMQPDLEPRKSTSSSRSFEPVHIDLDSLMALTKAPESTPGDGGKVPDEVKPAPEPEPEPEVAKVEPEPEPKPPVRKPRIKRKRVAKAAPAVTPAKTAAPETIAPAVADAASVASTTAVEPAGEPAAKPTASPQVTVTPKSVSVTSPGGSGGGKASSVDRKGMLKGYMRQLSRAVKKNYRYPRAAERAGLEGKVVVSVTIDDAGHILSVKLAKSSGHEILDKAALEAARSVGSLPAAPSALGWGQRSVKIPFRFKATS